MQRDEVSYSHSNLLFQQFTGCYIGCLGLTQKASGSIAVSPAQQPPQFTEDKAQGHDVGKEENNHINQQETKPGDLECSSPQSYP